MKLTRIYLSYLDLDLIKEKNLKINIKNKIKRILKDKFAGQTIPKGTELPIYFKRHYFKENTKIFCCPNNKAHAASAY